MVQVATLLTVIGEEAREVYSTFSGWENDGDYAKIGPVLEKFERYCQPISMCLSRGIILIAACKKLGSHMTCTALRKLAERCDFERITPDEILQDRLVFGIRDAKTRERLLRESRQRTDEICHSTKSMVS